MREQTQQKLEYKLLYSLVVAGKSAKFAEAVMQRFLGIKHVEDLDSAKRKPFEWVRYLGNNIDTSLRASRSGNYAKLSHAFHALATSGLDLKTCTPEDLEKIKGIGSKTSRFFILWTREGAPYAALDTHILKCLRYRGHKAPFSNPTGKKYAELEKVFLQEAMDRMHTPGRLDEMIWRWCQEKNNKGLDYMDKNSWPKHLQ